MTPVFSRLARKCRIQALSCSLAVLLCELISHPIVNMWVADDGSYIRTAQTLAATGRIVYTGWDTPILGWQLFLGSAFIHLFGFSLTTVRLSTLLVALLTAFFLQRALVLADISERNATFGTLAFVLSPLFLMLSVTFMTDIPGLFAIVFCLYSCLRALRTTTSRAAIGWLCLAVAVGTICGTSRQIAWLGVLVMVPSTLWLLRAQRSVLLAGIAANLTGILGLFACMHWFQHQPYTQFEHILVSAPSLTGPIKIAILGLLDIPFLLLPIMAIFLPGIRKIRPRSIAILSVLAFVYLFLALYPSHIQGKIPLEPTLGDWLNSDGIYGFTKLKGLAPRFLSLPAEALLTIVSIGGLIGLIASLRYTQRHLHRSSPQANAAQPTVPPSAALTWKQLCYLLGPFTLAYIVLLIPRTIAFALLDRYMLALVVVALFFLLRYYQEQIQPRLPLAALLPIALMAIYGVTVTHNLFSLYRARVELAAELRANGVPDTAVDNGWEYNFEVELQHAPYINGNRIASPANAYTRTPPLPAGTCKLFWYDNTPHVRPRYGVAFDPHACYGPAPFAPVHYSRWLASSPGTLYVVQYTPQYNGQPITDSSTP